MKKNIKHKRQLKSLISNIIFSSVALMALVICIIFILVNNSLRNDISILNKEKDEIEKYAEDHPYSQQEMDTMAEKIREEENTKEKDILLGQIKETIDNGYSPYYLFRSLFPDDVVVLTDGGYEFFPILPELKKNDYVMDNFLENEETKEVTYVNDNNEVLSKKGIDVSSHNGEIDWKKVAADGVDFAFVRVGFRGSTEGGIAQDTFFEDNMNGAIDNGVDVGVYFFSQAVDEKEAVEEAEFVLEAVSDYDLTMPIVFDIEKYENGRADKLSMEKYTNITKSFINRIKESGYDTMIYGNLNTMFKMIDLKEFEDCPKWFAYYTYPVYFPYEYSIWQYSSTGKVDGIEGSVDLNILVK